MLIHKIHFIPHVKINIDMTKAKNKDKKMILLDIQENS